MTVARKFIGALTASLVLTLGALAPAQRAETRRFQYEDADKLPEQRYEKPPVSDDATSIELNELRKRVIALEETVEILKRKCCADKAELSR